MTNWKNDQATEKQLEFIKKIRETHFTDFYKYGDKLTKGQAHEIISMCESNKLLNNAEANWMKELIEKDLEGKTNSESVERLGELIKIGKSQLKKVEAGEEQSTPEGIAKIKTGCAVAYQMSLDRIGFRV